MAKSLIRARAEAALNRISGDADAALIAAARADEDNPPLTDDELGRLKPSRGRPRLAKTKVPVTLRVDPDVLAAYKQTGRGWQTEMHEALKRAAPSVSTKTGPKAA